MNFEASNVDTKPGILDLMIGVLIVFFVSTSLGLGYNHSATSPLPLFAKLESFRPGDLRLGQVRESLGRGDVVLLDSRPRSAFKQGHLPGAKHLCPGEFEIEFPQLADTLRGKKAIVYCSGPGCPLADLVKLRLEEEGQKEVFIFRSGYGAWSADGLPMEKVDEN